MILILRGSARRKPIFWLVFLQFADGVETMFAYGGQNWVFLGIWGTAQNQFANHNPPALEKKLDPPLVSNARIETLASSVAIPSVSATPMTLMQLLCLLILYNCSDNFTEACKRSSVISKPFQPWFVFEKNCLGVDKNWSSFFPFYRLDYWVCFPDLLRWPFMGYGRWQYDWFRQIEQLNSSWVHEIFFLHFPCS